VRYPEVLHRLEDCTRFRLYRQAGNGRLPASGPDLASARNGDRSVLRRRIGTGDPCSRFRPDRKAAIASSADAPQGNTAEEPSRAGSNCFGYARSLENRRSPGSYRQTIARVSPAGMAWNSRIPSCKPECRHAGNSESGWRHEVSRYSSYPG
jgi:hypothetical protein